jgi:hypothetical protein
LALAVKLGPIYSHPWQRNAVALMGVSNQINARNGRGSDRLTQKTPVAQWAMQRDYMAAYNQLNSVICR